MRKNPTAEYSRDVKYVLILSSSKTFCFVLFCFAHRDDMFVCWRTLRKLLKKNNHTVLFCFVLFCFFVLFFLFCFAHRDDMFVC